MHGTSRCSQTSNAIWRVTMRTIAPPWCAVYSDDAGGTSNCGFLTIEQCRATVSGIEGFCEPNQFYNPRRAAARSQLSLRVHAFLKRPGASAGSRGLTLHMSVCRGQRRKEMRCEFEQSCSPRSRCRRRDWRKRRPAPFPTIPIPGVPSTAADLAAAHRIGTNAWQPSAASADFASATSSIARARHPRARASDS
jgi:hypothetical protein